MKFDLDLMQSCTILRAVAMVAISASVPTAAFHRTLLVRSLRTAWPQAVSNQKYRVHDQMRANNFFKIPDCLDGRRRLQHFGYALAAKPHDVLNGIVPVELQGSGHADDFRVET